MKLWLYTLATLGLFILLVACSSEELPDLITGIPSNVGEHLTEIPAFEQRTGDADLGKSYLLTGDYVSRGIPKDIFDGTIGSMLPSNNELKRDSLNEEIPFQYNAMINANGVELVAPNCFQCHGGYVDNQFILGLGNTAADYTFDQGALSGFLDQLVVSRYGNPSDTWDAYFPFSRAVSATGSHLITESVGANPADKLALVLAAHRDKDDLTWIDEPQITIPNELVPADVPAWWLLKKKSVMFSTGIGRGDYAKMMMGSSIITLQDSSEARLIDEQFVHVKEFIHQLEAPVYTVEIDMQLAAQGQELFELNCSTCHGTYGANERYKTLLVAHEVIKTDSLLAVSNYANGEFQDWFNTSWFGKDKHNAQIVSGDGYIAQPLDGIWATAPYLHNGSVPTLEDLLNSPQRPKYWRVADHIDNYDHDKMGLRYSEEIEKTDKYTYDTTLPGYGNMGHYFGDHLTDMERKSVIEYLKSL